MKIVIPMFLLIYTEILYPKQSTIIEGREDNLSTLPLVGVCMIMSTLQFVVTPRVFVAEFKTVVKKGDASKAFDLEDKEIGLDEKAKKEGIDPPSDDIFRNY